MTSTQKNKKILVLASTFPRWVGDTKPPFVFELSRRLAKNFDITILTPHFPDAKDYEDMNGLKVFRYHYFFPRFEKLTDDGGILPALKKNKLYYFVVPFFLIGQLIAAIKLTKTNRPDIIHAHWIIPQGLIALVIKKLFGVPYIITSHGSDLHTLKFNFLKKIILNNAQKITVVSPQLKNEIRKIDPHLLSKVEVVPMGVDTKIFNPSKYNASLKKKYKVTSPFLLFVGRLAPEKGLVYLINAMPSVLQKNPQSKLLIIGSGSLDSDLKSLVKKLKIAPSVIFVGAVKHSSLPSFYATADIFITTSLKEGFGLTTVEAGVSGCRLVVFKSKDNASSMVKNDFNGYLANKITPLCLADSINSAIKNLPSKHPKIILSVDTSKFDWEAIVAQYSDLYLL